MQTCVIGFVRYNRYERAGTNFSQIITPEPLLKKSNLENERKSRPKNGASENPYRCACIATGIHLVMNRLLFPLYSKND
jgi:hypothetical protein